MWEYTVGRLQPGWGSNSALPTQKCWQKNMRERDRNTVTYRELKKQAARNNSAEWEVLESSEESFLFDADLLSHLCSFPDTLLFISATLTAASQHIFPYIDPHRAHTHTLWKTHLTSHWPCSVLLGLHISDLFNWSHLLLCLWESSNGREVLLPYGSTGNSKDAWVVTNKRRRLDLTCMWDEVKPVIALVNIWDGNVCGRTPKENSALLIFTHQPLY